MAKAARPFTIEAIQWFRFPAEGATRRDIGRLQSGLRQLGLDIPDAEVRAGHLADRTVDALRAVQAAAGLPETGEPTPETVAWIKRELEHRYFAANKTRAARLHTMLGQLGLVIDGDERRRRTVGPSTAAAVQAFRERSGLPPGDAVDEALVVRLRAAALDARLASRRQRAKTHQVLLRAGRIAGLDAPIDRAELKGRTIGPTTRAAIEAFQRKYRLPVTGDIDPATDDKLRAVAASRPRPPKLLKVRSPESLRPVRRLLRLNMTGPLVGALQENLAFLGYPIVKAEHTTATFGGSTRAALVAYQRAHGLPPTGHFDRATRTAVNRDAMRSNPWGAATMYRYRLRGSVRDALWRGRPQVKVQIREQVVRGDGPLLAQGRTMPSGFFDIPYDPPRNPATKQVRTPYRLDVRFVAAGGAILGRRVLVDPPLIAWANLTEGTRPYRRASEFELRMTEVSRALGAVPIETIEETDTNQEVSRLATATGLAQDDVMRLVLAHRVAAELSNPALGPPACYAYLGQHLPPNLAPDLLASTHEWSLIDQLVDQAAGGLVFMDDDAQAEAFDRAVAGNLVPVAVVAQRDAVLAGLTAVRRRFALDKPILVGNGSLRALLRSSTVPAGRHARVADAFLAHQGLGSDFWAHLRERAGEFGGAAAVVDLETTVTVGQISQNHPPMLTFLKQAITDAGTPQIGSAADLAKLTREDWAGLIRAAGGAVPPGTDGETPDDRIRTYAGILVTEAERLFPTVALVAEVGRSPAHGLPRLADAQRFVDDHVDLDLRGDNVDRFVADRAPQTEPAVVADLRVLQRVHRLTPTAATGRVLLERRLHSSAQVLALGRERLVRTLEADGIDEPTALRVHGVAEHQYAQVLMRLSEYRFELHHVNPTAIVPYTFAAEEASDVLGEFPDLEVLFGSLDFCDCAHCQSVHGPAAYLADVLRWLGEVGGDGLPEVLLQRRPDLGSVKLNCRNTETPLPHVDLVCEILEAAVPAPQPEPDPGHQTTRSAAELRAYPEHVRHAAYDALRTADFPMDGAFDLWQEEARVFLDHLGVPRHELMRALGPVDAGLAGEFFGASSHETALIVTAEPTAAAQDRFWGFDTTRAEVSVAEFVQHARIGYGDLLDLLAVTWLGSGVGLDRPGGACDLDEQRLTGLTPAAFDRIHRLLRLWRRTGWSLSQLDRLLRAPGVGAGELDASALVALHDFRRVSQRLRLPFELAIDLYTTVDTVAGDAPSPYESRFLSPTVTNPVDPAFVLPLSGTEPLAAHRPALLAGLGVTEAELTLMLPRTGANLTLEHLTALLRLVAVARALRTPVTDLLVLVDLCAATVADPFAGPAATLELLDCHERVRASGVTVGELDALLNHRPDSPFGLRDDVVTQQLEIVRESLRGAPSAERAGRVGATVARAFGVTDRRAVALLAALRLEGVPLLDHLSAVASSGPSPAAAAAWRLLHKATLVVRRHRIDEDLLDWLLANGPGHGLLDLGALTATGPPATALFPAWRALATWLWLRAQYPEPENASLPVIFDRAADGAATIEEVRATVEALTGWAADDLAVLDGGDRSAYARVADWERLRNALGQLRRIGVPAAVAAGWADRDTAAAQARTAQEVRQAARSKYDGDAWLTVLTPLQDRLRERQRDALIAYLVEHSQRTVPPTINVDGREYANPAHWRDATDLLHYFLIDVEVSACQPTSRIKQAIGAAQMFVHRCLMNLEQPFVVITAEERADRESMDNWRQWRWMQSYRIWEANRLVFLYPENWIEPELRDDKSPFFVELESEILQQDITADNCETALRHYLEKVHEVSRLTIVGVYHEVENESPGDPLAPDRNVVHVVGRTRTDPARYFYRRFDLSYGTWTPWERIDLDITGDHVVPVVYNRKLHLFWLIFKETPQEVRKQPPAKATDSPSESPQPPGMLEIQLAWSVRTGRGWTPRQVGAHKLIHPWQRPVSSYNLKPRYKSLENQLWLDLYISTSREFNDTKFYDQDVDQPAYFTGVRFDAALRPWHSSSFIFDGGVVAVKLKAVPARYRTFVWTFSKAFGPAMVREVMEIIRSTSLEYVRTNFGDAGRAITGIEGPAERAPALSLPDGMRYQHTRLTNHGPGGTGRLNVLEAGQTTSLLTRGRSPFELAFSQDRAQFSASRTEQSPLFYQDAVRAHFIRPQWREIVVGYNRVTKMARYRWYPFYHPHTALFIRELNRSGVDGLLNRRIQRFADAYPPTNRFRFTPTYGPTARSVVDPTAETDAVDFSRHGAYAGYNWEIFFHIPMLIAAKLNQNQRFEEAMHWYHRIFDPTNTEGAGVPQRYWITRPFFEQNSDDYRRQRIEELLRNIDGAAEQIREWKDNPFLPHLVARHRPVAYQRAIVMRYIDNLIDWGDQLFRRDTIESINEATLRYVLAYELLGERPTKVPAAEHADRSYRELVAEGGLDPFGNRRVEVLMENFVGRPNQVVRTDPIAPPLPHLDLLYFRIPANDMLLGYWDTVADRLFKVRHCMNIEGVVRSLPLFEPPIDPALLVKAAAAGVDPSSVLGPGAAEVGQYRFAVLAAKAAELCAEVRGLGERLLGVLERHDDEGLALLRSAHEVALSEAVRQVRAQQVDEAQRSAEAIERGLPVIDKQIEYHGSIPRMNAWEVAAALSHGYGLEAEIVATVLGAVAGIAPLVPTVKAGAAGFGGSPTLTVEMGGANVADSAVNFLALFQGLAGILHQVGGMLGTQGGYTRQDDANDFQREVAEREKAQLLKQIEAARLRGEIAQRELDNHDLAAEQLRATDEFLRTKFSNQQLFDWMLRQLSTVYFQGYQLAYDMALRAEKSFQFELASPDTFIQFGYWDSLKKGLLAADRLANDLRRMESAYLDRNRRELEISKHVSLAQVAPLSLLALKTVGSCVVQLPEWLYDLDHPGHLRRRIKSVAITIPCVVGPYTNINCSVTVTNNGVRLSEDLAEGYGDPLVGGGARFARNPVPTDSVATSHGVNDRGVFDLRFTDDRYLPFEGAGAVSEWRIDLPPEHNQFDLSTIADVVLRVDYTAVAGGPALVAAARQHLDAILPATGVLLLDLPTEFGSEWGRFLHPPEGQEQELVLTLRPEHLPFWARVRSTTHTLDAAGVDLVLDSPHDGAFDARLVLPGAPGPIESPAPRDAAFGGRPHLSATTGPGSGVLGGWRVQLKKDTDAAFTSLTDGDVVHAYLVLRFGVR